MAKIPVGDTINYAYSFTFGNLITIVGLTWLPLAITAALGYYAQTLWFDWASKFPMFMSSHPDPQAMMAAFSNMGSYAGIGFLCTLVTWFLSAVVAVAVTTQAMGTRTGTTYVHIAAGPPEWRVFGGYVRLFFAVMAVFFIATLGVVVCVLIAKAISPEGGVGAFVGVILGIAIFCLALLTIVRMAYLLVPSIVAEPGKGGLARSYHLTRGNFWRIFIVTVVVALPTLLVAGAIQSAIIGNSFMGPLMQMMQNVQSGQHASSDQMQEMFTQMMANFRANFLPAAIVQFISSIFLAGLIYSAAAFAYRSLSGTAPEAVPAPAPTPTPA